MENKNISILLRKKVILTKSQTQLYLLLVDRQKSNIPISLNELKYIWVNYSCRSTNNGIPMYYNQYHKNIGFENGIMKYEGKEIPMTEYQIISNTLQWLNSSIGILVLKGYLKIIPTFDLEELTC